MASIEVTPAQLVEAASQLAIGPGQLGSVGDSLAGIAGAARGTAAEPHEGAATSAWCRALRDYSEQASDAAAALVAAAGLYVEADALKTGGG